MNDVKDWTKLELMKNAREKQKIERNGCQSF